MKKIQKYLLNYPKKIKINSKDIEKNDVFIALKGKKKNMVISLLIML